MAPRRSARPQPREARDAAATARRGVGPVARARHELPARVHGAGAAQARADTVTTALLHHGAWHGLPVRARGLTIDGDDVVAARVRRPVPSRVACDRFEACGAGPVVVVGERDAIGTQLEPADEQPARAEA